jgi:polysaccharide pyruvyl transferase WcaK-like protein
LDYVAKLERFVSWLLGNGYSVRLLIGNWGVDQRPVDELLDFVRIAGNPDWQNRITTEPIADADDLFQEIAKTDVVVASRFHNVVSALMLGRPVISLGYHEKNEALLAQMGLQSYCQHIEHFSVDLLIQQFQSLASELEQASRRIQEKCAQYRQKLDEQYCRVLCPEAAGAFGY